MSSDMEDLKIPTMHNYMEICFEKYNLKELKHISKVYKLKTTLKKDFLISNIKELFAKSKNAIKIQSVVRMFYVKKWIQSHGPALTTRECVNDSDFLTMESVKDIPMEQFFSYRDVETNHIYGFDILSIYTLIQNSKKEVLNPYNRKILEQDTIKKMKEMVKYSSIIKKKINLEIEKEPTEKSFEFRSLDLFQTIDLLGNYSNHLWFTLLTRRQLLRFIRELNDVWFYRCQIPRDTQEKICPRGNPFRHVNLHRMDDELMKGRILKVMEEMVYSGVDRDSRCLGSYYVLGCLTLVNSQAASAMPWLYENFAYF